MIRAAAKNFNYFANYFKLLDGLPSLSAFQITEGEMAMGSVIIAEEPADRLLLNIFLLRIRIMKYFPDSDDYGVGRSVRGDTTSNTIIFLMFALLLFPYLTGCDTYVDRTVKISTEPAGAMVLLNGNKQDVKTPITITKVRWYKPKEGHPSSASIHPQTVLN